ncbi:hypothetical protein [Pseudarthrobacter sp. L1SW]|uniref:hypothetical protein n=1 Tax=Pseudarthrobacter sp. L1SW TaxID=2851598 RepID=UPI001E3F0DA5|nr:hypothetical protein [Pseudarthrobacter sp. L1SW]UEL29419.1 hypothetical protein KTR40_04635 [Pseudarthrobacter sp. L1SW]
MRTGSRRDTTFLPRWARTAVATYLLVTVLAVGAAALTRAVGMEPGFHQALMLAVIVLTLPVSAAYFVIGLFDSGSTGPGGFRLGALGLLELIRYLGYLGFAAVNAAAFRWLVLGLRNGRSRTPSAHARGPSREVVLPAHGVNSKIRNLLWVVPAAVLLSLPQWFVASFAWCGVSGCSGGGFGVARGGEWIAASLSAVNGLILAVAVFVVPWFYPTGRRVLVALIAGTLFALLGAAVTHG